MATIFSFEDHRKEKELQKEKESNRQFYAQIDRLIAHLKPKSPKEGTNGKENTNFNG